MNTIDIKSLSMQELEAFVTKLGQPVFRARQIYSWLHKKQARTFDEMTSLSTQFREQLADECYINSLNLKKRLVSGMDGTVKYLYGLQDAGSIETVLLPQRHGNSLCISTQAGCRMGCVFCASTQGGLVRNLTPAEILDQISHTARDTGQKIDSVVLMGIGEPLDNFDNVLTFLQILQDPDAYGMSLRHVSLSTCGLVDRIRALAQHRLALTLSVSLHAPDDMLRNTLMPINRRWPLRELMAACRDYFDKTGRRISYEYALILDTNDSKEHARALARLLGGQNCHVNLIPHNEVAGLGWQRSTTEQVRIFRETLERGGINATVRREFGSDINAACGQLRRATGTADDTVAMH